MVWLLLIIIHHVHHEDLNNGFINKDKEKYFYWYCIFLTYDLVVSISQIDFESSPPSFMAAYSSLNWNLLSDVMAQAIFSYLVEFTRAFNRKTEVSHKWIWVRSYWKTLNLLKNYIVRIFKNTIQIALINDNNAVFDTEIYLGRLVFYSNISFSASKLKEKYITHKETATEYHMDSLI